ncbi:MAG: phage portal protein [Oscillospiraceae bacterium]|nr:phage portal protein [Oscillospiraceae bacterium]
MFNKLLNMLRQALRRLVAYKNISEIYAYTNVISQEMENAIELWYNMYHNKAPWLGDNVKSLSLPSTIASEMARMVTLEMAFTVSGSPRADYINSQLDKFRDDIRIQLEYGLAFGSLAIKPYVKDGNIYFDYTPPVIFFPIEFDDNRRITAAAFVESIVSGQTTYTRVEYHKLTEKGVVITNNAYKSVNKNDLGMDCPLTAIPQWAELQPETLIEGVDRLLIAYFRVPLANTIDCLSPIGASIYSQASGLIEQADRQYSRLLWEYEGGELAVDVDANAVKPKKDKRGYEVSHLNDRLYRKLDTGEDSTYHVFNPALRDESIIRGLDKIKMQIEDTVGLARGSLSEVNAEARTATELKILRQRTYATVSDIQKELQRVIDDIVYINDKYCELYKLTPPGSYETSYSWDDSIINDEKEQREEKLEMLSNNLLSRKSYLMWYYGITDVEAQKMLDEIDADSPSVSAMFGSEEK